MKIKLTGIGSDPEVFVMDKTGKVVSGIGKVGGTKEKPDPLGTPGYFVQEDNVLAEFNIPPAKTDVDFANNIEIGLRLLNLKLDASGHTVLIKTSHVMDEDQLTDDRAKAFGCTPDIVAWNNIEQVANMPSSGLRTAGGHFHFGYENPTEELNIKLAKAFDIFTSLPSVLLDPDKIRRSVYGGAGSFRHKPYGLEYRSLSSFWIADKVLSRWVFNQAVEATRFVEDGGVDKLDFMDGYDILTAINFCDEVLAKDLINRFNVKMP